MSLLCSNSATMQPTEIPTSAANCIESCSVDSATTGGTRDNKNRGADPGDRRLDGGLGHLREPQFARDDSLHC
jgi:hypothetical protein